MKTFYLFLTTLVFLQAGCNEIHKSRSKQDILDLNKKTVIKAHEIWSKGKYDLIPELYTEDFVCHFVRGPEWKGHQGLLAAVSSLHEGFPDWNEEIVKLVAEGDYVVSYFKSSGTHLGEFNGLAPTGRKVLIDEFAIFRLINGRIAEQWGLPDIDRMNVQLGIINNH